jgi:hypothetical protein
VNSGHVWEYVPVASSVHQSTYPEFRLRLAYLPSPSPILTPTPSPSYLPSLTPTLAYLPRLTPTLAYLPQLQVSLRARVPSLP